MGIMRILNKNEAVNDNLINDTYIVGVYPGDLSETIKVIAPSSSRRPPTQYGERQGAHTFSYHAFLRPLEILLENVTLQQAKEYLGQDFHIDLKIAAMFGMAEFNSRDVYAVQKLEIIADNTHEKILQTCPSNPFLCPLIAKYITIFCYIHNLLPCSTADQSSSNRGESNAIKKLFAIDSHFLYSDIIESLSKLLDPDTIHQHNASSIAFAFYISCIYKTLKILNIARKREVRIRTEDLQDLLYNKRYPQHAHLVDEGLSLYFKLHTSMHTDWRVSLYDKRQPIN